MLNPDYIPDQVLTDILSAKGWPDTQEGYDKVAQLTLPEAFEIYLHYNGIIHYTNQILTAVTGLQLAALEAEGAAACEARGDGQSPL